MSKKRNGERFVGFGDGEIAKSEGGIDKVQCSGSVWFFQTGCHASEGIDFKVTVFAAANGCGCFKGGTCVLAEFT